MKPVDNHYLLTIGSLSDQALWTQLLEVIRPRTPFDFPVWNEIWMKHFGKSASPMIISVSRKNTDDALVMPMVREGDTLRFFGSTDCVDYHTVVGKNITAELLAPAVKAITQDSKIKHLILESMPENTTLYELKRTFEQQGWHSELHLEDVAPRVKLPTSREAYLASLSKKTRSKVRQLEKSGVIQHGDLVTPIDIKQAIDTLINLHKKSSSAKAAYMTAEKEAFFREVTLALAEKNIVRIAYLDMDQQRIACVLSFVLDDIQYFYSSGFDPTHAHLSVGFLNYIYALSRSIEKGIKVVDFMRGNEAYKYRFGCFDRQLYQLTLKRPII
jgi:CelD/BcsL family acetyltransferase involved in cellulose biosynthesis